MALDEAYKQRATRYHRKQLHLTLAEETATLALLAVWVMIAPWIVGKLQMGRYGLLIFLAVAIYASYQVFLFALDYLQGYRLEHQFSLSTETFGKWLWRHTKAVTLGGLLMGALLLLLYTALWYLPYWYVWTWLGWMVFSVVLAQLFPVLILPIFYPSKPFEDQQMCQRLEKLAQAGGLKIKGVYRLDLSVATTKANAMLAGLGRTRRVLLGDTLLDKLTPEQIEVVFAHELGHHVHRHLRKTLLLHGLASIIVLALVWAILGPFAGADEQLYPQAVARLPALLLAIGLFSFVWRPILFAISRLFETQSDTYALQATGDPDSYVAAFERLAVSNLADPDPPRWVEIMFYEHPPIMRRIELASKWKKS